MRDPVHDAVVWREYLDSLADAMTARGRARRVRLMGIRHHGPGSARAVRACLDAAPARHRAHRGSGGGRRDRARSPSTRRCEPPVAMLGHVARPSRARCVLPVRLVQPRVGRADVGVPARRAGAVHRPAVAARTRCPRRRRAARPRTAGGRHAPDRPAGRARCALPATTTRSGGGRTSSSTAAHAVDPFDADRRARSIAIARRDRRSVRRPRADPEERRREA